MQNKKENLVDIHGESDRKLPCMKGLSQGTLVKGEEGERGEEGREGKEKGKERKVPNGQLVQHHMFGHMRTLYLQE